MAYGVIINVQETVNIVLNLAVIALYTKKGKPGIFFFIFLIIWC